MGENAHKLIITGPLKIELKNLAPKFYAALVRDSNHLKFPMRDHSLICEPTCHHKSKKKLFPNDCEKTNGSTSLEDSARFD